MLINLMLAQAQTCYYELALKKGMKPALIARLGMQCITFYEEALRAARGPTLGSILDKAWANMMEGQVAALRAGVSFQMSKGDLAQAEASGQGLLFTLISSFPLCALVPHLSVSGQFVAHCWYRGCYSRANRLRHGNRATYSG